MISGSDYHKLIINKHNLYKKVIDKCSNLLGSNEAVETKKYLNSRVSNYYQNKFHFGYFPSESEIDLLLKNSDITWDNLVKLGLAYGENRLVLGLHNLVFPINDWQGNIVGISGRSILPSEDLKLLEIDKYKNSLNYKKNSYLFALNAAKRSIVKRKSAVLVEGQIDCVTCHSHGFTNTVALTGSSFNFFHLFLLKNLCNKIYLALDNDSAGQKSTKKIINKYSKYIEICPLIIPEEYKDPDNYLRNSKDHKVFDIVLTGE